MMYSYTIRINDIACTDDWKPVFTNPKNEELLFIKSEKPFNQHQIIDEINRQFPEKQIFENPSLLYKRDYLPEPTHFNPDGFYYKQISFSENENTEFPTLTEFDLVIQANMTEEQIIFRATENSYLQHKNELIRYYQRRISSGDLFPPPFAPKLSASFNESQYNDLQPNEIRVCYSQSMYSSVYKFYRDNAGFVYSIYNLHKSTIPTQNNVVNGVYRISTDIVGHFYNNQFITYPKEDMFVEDPEIAELRNQLYQNNQELIKLPSLDF